MRGSFYELFICPLTQIIVLQEERMFFCPWLKTNEFGRWILICIAMVVYLIIISSSGLAEEQKDNLSPSFVKAISMDMPAPPNTLRILNHIAMSWVIGNHVAEPLVYVNNENQFIPLLAREYRISDTHMDLFLRHDVRFQDNTPFDAAAVVRNYNHYIHSAQNTAPYFTLDLRLAFQSMEAVAPDHIRIHFKPGGFIGQILVFLRSFYMYSPAFFDMTKGVYPSGNQANIWTPGPWGTGPYRLVAVPEKNAVAVLIKNSSYWQTGLPKTDAIILYGPKKYSSEQAHKLMIEGKADLFDAVNPSMLPAMTSSSHLILVVKHPNSHLTSLFNTRRPGSPLKDIRVRKALNLLIDRKTLFRYVSHGTAHLTPFIYPLSEKQTLSSYPFDPIAGKALLKQAGFDINTPLPLKIGFFSAEEKLARAIGAMLADNGIQVQFERYLTRQEYYQHVKNYTHGPDNPIEGETWDLNIVNSGLYTNTVATHFEALYSKGGNRWIESDPMADQLFVQAMKARTPEGVDQGLRALERYAYEQYYQMPIYIRPTILAANKRIKDNSFSGSGYLLNLKDIQIGQDQ